MLNLRKIRKMAYDPSEKKSGKLGKLSPLEGC